MKLWKNNLNQYGALSQRDLLGRSLSFYFPYVPEETNRPDSIGVSSSTAEMLLSKHGKNDLPSKERSKWFIFLSLLFLPMAILIWIAVIIEYFIKNYTDMYFLLTIQFLNASISFFEIKKADDALQVLKASLRREATAFRDGHWCVIDASTLVPGDLVLLAAGNSVPADCQINKSSQYFIEVDQSALTGESFAVTKKAGDKCLLGSTIIRGQVEATVEYTGKNTYLGKTSKLLEDEEVLSDIQNIVIDILVILALVSVALSSIVYFYLVQTISVIATISFIVFLVVASMPLGVDIVTNTTLALGSRDISEHGAIVTRLSAVEDMAAMSILCCDKTGSLTTNKMKIQADAPVYKEGETRYSLLRYAAMASRWEDPPKDAVDKLILGEADLKSLGNIIMIDHIPFDSSIKLTESTVRDVDTNYVFGVIKGAPHVVLKRIDDLNLMKRVENDVFMYGKRGIRCLAVAKTNTVGKWEILGMLTFIDPPRRDSRDTIDNARDFGINVKMLTGDHLIIAKEAARELGFGSNIQTFEVFPKIDKEPKSKIAEITKKCRHQCENADGFAEVYPEHKYLIVESLRQLGYVVGMTGDGVNDGPALRQADLGIAVYEATDVARISADVILTESGLSAIIHGVLISRCVFIRIRNFIEYRIGATLHLLLFFFIALFTFNPYDYQPEDNPDEKDWPTYFFMPSLLLMWITIFNDVTLISIAYDAVIPSDTPEKWNLPILLCLGIVMGGVGCLSSLLLLWILLNSWSSVGVFAFFGIPGLSFGQIMLGMYLSLSVTGFLSLFCVRSGESYFYHSLPSKSLFITCIVTLSISTLLACFWPSGFLGAYNFSGLEYRAPRYLPILIWIYCFFVFLFQVINSYSFYFICHCDIFGPCSIQDFCKVQCYKYIRFLDLFGINGTGYTAHSKRMEEMTHVNNESTPLLQPV